MVLILTLEIVIVLYKMLIFIISLVPIQAVIASISEAIVIGIFLEGCQTTLTFNKIDTIDRGSENQLNILMKYPDFKADIHNDQRAYKRIIKDL